MTLAGTGTATSIRWYPNRAGIVNIWRYVDEVFAFHQGRLLLRGPNGSGKSMALELLFPFLLDARADRSRLSSAAKARGGLFDRMMSGIDASSRVGFLWAEFATSAAPVHTTFTIGVRLRASNASRKVKPDWFTTTQRIGHDLRLVDDTRTPLSIGGLRDSIGSAGRVHDSADDYRTTVRETLFPEFGSEQYEALLSALLALRVEKVSQNISPERLGNILTDSLPPLDEREIASLAEGFEKLDRRKEDLQRLRHQFHHVGQLAKHLRIYARNVLAAQSAAVRAAETTRDDVTRNERTARTTLQDAEQALDAVQAKDRAAAEALEELKATIDALRTREAFREGAEIEPLRRRASDAEQLAKRAAEAAQRSESEVEKATKAVENWSASHKGKAAECRQAHNALAAAADELGAGAPAALLDDEAPNLGDEQMTAWISGRRKNVADVRAALRELADLLTALGTHESQLLDDREEVDHRTVERDEAQARLDSSIDAYWKALQAWASSSIAFGDLLEPELVGDDSEPGQVRLKIDRIAESARADLVRRETLHEAEVRRLREEQEAANEELQAAQDGAEQPPIAPDGRRDRSQAEGSPLWRVLDFRDGVDEPTRDRIESALATAGLLDAWIFPGGQVEINTDESDLILDATRVSRASRPLSQVLRVDDTSKVPERVASAILQHIELCDSALTADSSAAIGTDGSFRFSNLVGTAPKQPARYIGAASRERERIRKIAALKERIFALQRSISAERASLLAIDQARAAIAAELALLPDETAIADARKYLDKQESRLVDADARLRKTERKRNEAEKAVQRQQLEVDHLAATHRLPTQSNKLDEYSEALASTEDELRRWARLARELAVHRAEFKNAQARLSEGETAKREAELELDERARSHRSLRTQLQVLQQSVGAEYREILDQLGAAEDAQTTQTRLREEFRRSQLQMATKVGELGKVVEDATEKLRAAEETRAASHQRFVDAIGDRLPEDAAVPALEEPLEGVTAVLGAARRIAAQLDDIAGTSKAIARANRAVHEALHKAGQELGGRVDFSFEESASGDWSLLRASSQGIRQTTPQLVDSLSAELETAENELAEDEQRLFDETLTGSVREHVASRIRLATELVDRLNSQLEGVKTDVAGVGVRLRWIVDSPDDAPAALRSARQLLLKDPADLADSERQSLYDFFRSRIDVVRGGDDSLAGWDSQLVAALDYRSWHSFQLQVVHAAWDGYRDATPSRWSKLSTGEKSIALHLPMLASIVAHYQTGSDRDGPRCPRLIVLDELFAGVDPSNRSKLLGMLVTWDLDAIFTSDHEWCAYPTLDGIAIHHVHADGNEVGDPVTTSRFIWNGRRRVASPVEAQRADVEEA